MQNLIDFYMQICYNKCKFQFGDQMKNKEVFMGNYNNFELVVYFIAHGVKHLNEAVLEDQIAFFKRYMRIDKVYIEPFRDGCFAGEAQLRL